MNLLPAAREETIGSWPGRAVLWLVTAAAGVSLLLSPVATVSGRMSLAAAMTAGLFLITHVRPALGAYTLLVSTPLIVGIERGTFLPWVRPSEIVLGVVFAALVMNVAGRLLRGERFRLQLNRVDVAILLLAVTSSVLPLLWMVARGLTPEADDYLYAATFWKYYALYLVFRVSVTTVREVRTCLWLSMGGAAVAAVIGMLQALQLFGIDVFLGRYYAPLGITYLTSINRATSTLASSIAMGDVMTFHCVVAIALLVYERRHRTVLAAVALLFALGAIASGQFSGVIALGIGIVTVGAITGHLGRIVAGGVVVAGVASIALQPIIERRLLGFETPEGRPPSWTGRLENLETFFIPEIMSDYGYLLGVRPAARVAAPEHWREWVFIESGHLWLLWVGGLPLFFAFLLFLWATLTTTARAARARSDAVAAAAATAFSAVAIIAVLMAIDPHLSTRGVAETLFALLALARVGKPPGGPTPIAPDMTALTQEDAR